MIAEEKAKQNWSGAEPDTSADHNGIATETRGREDTGDIYKKDILDELIKEHDEDSIFKRGNEKRIRLREDE